MAIGDIGTISWARRTGGRLTADERDQIQRRVVELQAQEMAERSETARDAIRHMDFDAVLIPDSALAKKAEAYVAEHSPESLINHCHRTYLWGCLLAQLDGKKIEDIELFYVASLLHDLGATKHFFGQDKRVHCFAVEGGFAAEEFLLKEGMDPERVEIAAEAIILHLGIIGEEYGLSAHYLNSGARCDVQGHRATEIPIEIARRVLTRHPGLDFRDMFGDFIKREITMRPDARLSLAIQMMAGGDTPQLFPWAETES